jgi:hypothetical protein
MARAAHPGHVSGLAAWTRPERWLAAAGISAAAVATTALFFVSRGRWCDPIIDGGREWLLAQGLSRGKLLYRDIHYWSGPIAIYFQAAFFRVFGASFGSLALAGCAISLLLLAVLWRSLRRVSGLAEAALWTALAIPAVIFMPGGGGILVGMSYRAAAAFGLAALAALATRRRPSSGRLLAAGTLAGLSGLCRTEFGVCVALGATVGLAAAKAGPGLLRRVSLFLGAGVAVFGAVVGTFAAVAGSRRVIMDGHLLLTGIPEPTRRFAREFSGIGDWPGGLQEMVYSALIWAGLVLAVGLFARRDDRGGSVHRLGLLAAILALLVFLAARGASTAGVHFSAAPVVCLAAALAGAWLRGGRRAGALAGFGVAGLLLFHRRPFHIGDSWYVGAPLLFACVAAAGLLRIACLLERRRRLRVRFVRGLRWTLGAAVLFAFAGRFAHYTADSRVPVPGTDGMITARSETAAGLTRLAQEIRVRTGPDETLAVFPEGEVLNAITGRDNSMRYELCLPDTVTPDREAEVLADLTRANPAAIVLTQRLSPEYGASVFGVNYAQSLGRWISAHYDEVPDPAHGRRPFEGVGRLFLRRTPGVSIRQAS